MSSTLRSTNCNTHLACLMWIPRLLLNHLYLPTLIKLSIQSWAMRIAIRIFITCRTHPWYLIFNTVLYFYEMKCVSIHHSNCWLRNCLHCCIFCFLVSVYEFALWRWNILRHLLFYFQVADLVQLYARHYNMNNIFSIIFFIPLLISPPCSSFVTEKCCLPHVVLLPQMTRCTCLMVAVMYLLWYRRVWCFVLRLNFQNGLPLLYIFNKLVNTQCFCSFSKQTDRGGVNMLSAIEFDSNSYADYWRDHYPSSWSATPQVVILFG